VTGTEANINPANPSPCLGLQTAAGCPLADTPSANPYFVNGPVAGSSRGRVIGTGDMVNAVYNNADSIGYAFWSFSSFNGKQGHVKYLTVNGVDPLFSTFNTNPGGTGALPQCPSTPCVLPLDNIKNGAYPIWSKYRAVWNPYDSASVVTNVVANAQTVSTSLLSDLVPATALNVFRSHFGQVASTHGTGYTGNNGFKAGIPETGGDMGGQVLTVQSELDVLVDTGGAQQINEKW
jgi:hypothetical protein